MILTETVDEMESLITYKTVNDSGGITFILFLKGSKTSTLITNILVLLVLKGGFF